MPGVAKWPAQAQRGLSRGKLLPFALALFGTFPLVVVIWDSLRVEGAFSLRNYLAVYQRSANLAAVVNTLEMAALSMLLATTLAFLLSWLLYRSDLPWRGFLRALFLVPYLAPPFVGAIAWTQLLNPRVGYLNRFFMQIFGLAQAPLDIYSLGGLVWVMGVQEMPLAFLAISTAMQQIDPSWEEAARLAGAGRWRMIRQITLPVVLPGVLTGAMLVFVALVVWGLARRWRTRVQDGTAQGMDTALVFTLFSLGWPLLFCFVAGQVSTVWVARYLLPFLPFFLILVALGVDLIPWQWAGPVVLALLCVVSVYALQNMYNVQQKEDWRGVATYLSPRFAAQDLIVLMDNECRVPFSHYFGSGGTRVEVSRFADDAALDRAVAEVQRKQRGGHLWLVVSHADGQSLEQRLGALPGLSLVARTDFVGIKLVEYSWP